jgi:hypothetical protein
MEFEWSVLALNGQRTSENDSNEALWMAKRCHPMSKRRTIRARRSNIKGRSNQRWFFRTQKWFFGRQVTLVKAPYKQNSRNADLADRLAFNNHRERVGAAVAVVMVIQRTRITFVMNIFTRTCTAIIWGVPVID